MQVSYSGYRCAARYWPEVFAGADLQTKLRVLAALARVRSVLVKGYETMVMVGLMHLSNLATPHWCTSASSQGEPKS